MYNIVQDFKATPIGYSEPVDIATAKAFCRVNISNSAQDDLFSLWITTAREAIEQVTGLSLIEKDVQCQLINAQGGIELPGGPITNDPTFTDIDGNELDIRTVGIDFLSIAKDSCERGFLDFRTGIDSEGQNIICASYTAGYSSDGCPSWVKTAILNQVSYYYENRGIESAMNGVCPNVTSLVAKYSRKGILI